MLAEWFIDYLTNEYVLGDNIWLYGSVISYDAFENVGYVFLRDFTLESIEERYEDRLAELRKRGIDER